VTNGRKDSQQPTHTVVPRAKLTTKALHLLELIRRHLAMVLQEGEQALLARIHFNNFKHRSRFLPDSYFIEPPRSLETITSMSSECWLWFERVPVADYGNLASLRFLVMREYSPRTFLYWGKGAALLRYLVDVGPIWLREVFQNRRRILRVLRLGPFRTAGQQPDGALLWWIVSPDAPPARPEGVLAEEQLARIASPALASLRGREQVRTLLIQVGFPLTVNELSNLSASCSGLNIRECSLPLDEQEVAEEENLPEIQLLEEQSQARMLALWAAMDPVERRLLVLRRWHEDLGEEHRPPFEAIRAQLGEHGAEHYRRMERRLFERLRSGLPPEQVHRTMDLLLNLIAQESSQTFLVENSRSVPLV
jgi:hypothetical protein